MISEEKIVPGRIKRSQWKWLTTAAIGMHCTPISRPITTIYYVASIPWSFAFCRCVRHSVWLHTETQRAMQKKAGYAFSFPRSGGKTLKCVLFTCLQRWQFSIYEYRNSKWYECYVDAERCQMKRTSRNRKSNGNETIFKIYSYWIVTSEMVY